VSNIVINLQTSKVNSFPETPEHRTNLRYGTYILTLPLMY